MKKMLEILAALFFIIGLLFSLGAVGTMDFAEETGLAINSCDILAMVLRAICGLIFWALTGVSVYKSEKL